MSSPVFIYSFSLIPMLQKQILSILQQAFSYIANKFHERVPSHLFGDSSNLS